MANTINLKIITPERIVFESPVDQVTAVSRDGELTILPGHEPLVTTLAIDVMRFKRQGEEETAAIIGGIMEVSTSEVTIMSDMAEMDVEIDETRAKQAKEKAEAEKIQKTDKMDVYVSEMALSRAMARLRAAELGKLRKRGNR
ncbi:MAG: ATP synthase F1 subunit epsilon [Candidatus Obscuribacter sp.]|jgi:F-type H+-transporting ATPase subunit epsilon|nr:ATP synthase F1 subunit epsilon [Candidatus Obscuribacter sp.]MBK9201607.1 ATP synthase F1 subunit epsilon [Candidatus Obscuribacter sp.]MBK9770638.1 ATP synthase F1 subunit epsilon [Candidatus Obscuribacter sp.]MBL0188717.1 ATP synthase F1 subunit epsilon [Candidatus Obscuribacter sp.]MDQ5964611.1 F-type H+-transporting ATPase subunit epsilon [Cyanobacteriota bacterium erpe_2018_sw_39hr_WHONDRS-SW48-000098_B_bin.30]